MLLQPSLHLTLRLRFFQLLYCNTTFLQRRTTAVVPPSMSARISEL